MILLDEGIRTLEVLGGKPVSRCVATVVDVYGTGPGAYMDPHLCGKPAGFAEAGDDLCEPHRVGRRGTTYDFDHHYPNEANE